MTPPTLPTPNPPSNAAGQPIVWDVPPGPSAGGVAPAAWREALLLQLLGYAAYHRAQDAAQAAVKGPKQKAAPAASQQQQARRGGLGGFGGWGRFGAIRVWGLGFGGFWGGVGVWEGPVQGAVMEWRDWGGAPSGCARHATPSLSRPELQTPTSNNF